MPEDAAAVVAGQVEVRVAGDVDCDSARGGEGAVGAGISGPGSGGCDGQGEPPRRRAPPAARGERRTWRGLVCGGGDGDAQVVEISEQLVAHGQLQRARVALRGASGGRWWQVVASRLGRRCAGADRRLPAVAGCWLSSASAAAVGSGWRVLRARLQRSAAQSSLSKLARRLATPRGRATRPGRRGSRLRAPPRRRGWCSSAPAPGRPRSPPAAPRTRAC